MWFSYKVVWKRVQGIEAFQYEVWPMQWNVLARLQYLEWFQCVIAALSQWKKAKKRNSTVFHRKIEFMNSLTLLQIELSIFVAFTETRELKYVHAFWIFWEPPSVPTSLRFSVNLYIESIYSSFNFWYCPEWPRQKSARWSFRA